LNAVDGRPLARRSRLPCARERGNQLVYSSSTLEADPQAIEDLGGIEREYLNHRHEARPECD
jgi:hypothetical protein